MAQSVSHRLLTVEAQVQSQTIPCDICSGCNVTNTHLVFSQLQPNALPYKAIHLVCQTNSRPNVPLFAALFMCVDRDFAVILWRHVICVPVGGEMAFSEDSWRVWADSHLVLRQTLTYRQIIDRARRPGAEDGPLISCLTLWRPMTPIVVVPHR